MKYEKIVLLLFSIVFVCGTVAADTLLVMQESYGDEPAKESRYWFGEKRAARIDENGSIIGRLDEGKAYFVDHATHTYSILAYGAHESLHSAGKAKLTKTDETKKIGSWNARKSLIEIPFGDGEMQVEIWTSTEVGVDMATYKQLLRATAERARADWMNVFLELEGFPVLQVSSYGPIKSTQKLISAETKAAPAGTYSPPADYKQK